MSEEKWNIGNDEDSVWMIYSMQNDIKTQEAELKGEINKLKTRIMNMKCDECIAKPTSSNDMSQCLDRIEEIECLLRKLAKKEQYYDELLSECDAKPRH